MVDLVTSKQVNNSPFFIVGTPLSGTTLLRLMINMHSRLCVPPESHFIVDLANKFKGEFSLADFCTALSSHCRFLDWEIPHDEIYGQLSNSHPELRNLFNIVFHEFALRKGKPRWGDKTPNYVEHIELLHHIFPDAKIIHIIRDGRDVACSLKDVPWYSGNIIDSALLWRRMVVKGCNDGHLLGDEYLEIFYEDLTSDPEGTLRAVCQHLGEQFEPQMLSYYENATDQIPKHRIDWHQNVSQPITTTRAGRWQRDLSDLEVWQFENHAGQLLSTLGYVTNNKFPTTKVLNSMMQRLLRKVRRSLKV